MSVLTRIWRMSKVSVLLAGSFWGASLLTSPLALALTQDEIVNKLQPIPVFLILNSEGRPLSASTSETDNADRIPTVFVDLETAQSYLGRAQEADDSAEINITSLGTLYEQTINESSHQPTPLLYFPSQADLQEAVKVNPDYKGDVPLFYAVRQVEQTGENGETVKVGNLIRIRDGNNQVQWPVFFSRDDLQMMIDRFVEQNPNDANNIAVEVMPLSGLIAAMNDNQDTALQEQLSQLRLFPSSDVLNEIQPHSSGTAPGGSTPSQSAPAQPAPAQ